MKFLVLQLGDEGSRGEWAAATDAMARAFANDVAVVLTCRTTGGILQSRRRLRQVNRALHAIATMFELHVSRSATDDAIAWAACKTRPIGVDVQSAPARLDEALLLNALTENERAWLRRQAHTERSFAQLWAGKEAVLKAFGVGLAWRPSVVDVLPRATRCQRVDVTALGSAWLRYPRGASDETPLAVALNMGHDPG